MSNAKQAPRGAKTAMAADPATEPTKPAESAKGDLSVAPILLYRDYWGRDGVRHAKGSVVSVELAVAKRLIGEGKGDRADPLPGEAG